MDAPRHLNLTIAFILEPAILLAIGYAALTLPLPLALQIITALAAAILMAVMWGGSPRPGPACRCMAPHGAFQIAWFGTGAVALATTGRATLAAALAAVYILNSVGARFLCNREGRRQPAHGVHVHRGGGRTGPGCDVSPSSRSPPAISPARPPPTPHPLAHAAWLQA